MNCPDCGREVETVGPPDLDVSDEDAMEYYCGICERHYIYDHFSDEWLEDDE